MRFRSAAVLGLLAVMGAVMGSCSRGAGRSVNVDREEILALAQGAGIPELQLCVCDGKGGIRSTVGDSDSIRVFQAASLSKPVFSYIVMRLVNEGKMDLDTPVASYTDIDRFTDREMASRITPRIVLSHTTGLYNWACSPTSEKWDSSPIDFHFPVDECFGYSGEAYAFLQRAVESVTGKSLDEVAREYVFEPFGMPLTSYGWIPAYDDLALPGYDREGVSHGLWRSISPNCAYTLRTTCEDYMRFLISAVIEGRGLKAETHREWLTPRSHAIRYRGRERECDADMYWCLGMGVKVSFDGEGHPVARQLWHWGDNDYWKALFVVDLENGTALDYFTNSSAGHDIADAICQSVTGHSFGIQAWIGDEDDE